MADNRMKFEMIVRTVYNCDRYGIYGANADIYDGLHSAIFSYNKDPKSPEKAFEAGKRIGKVKAILYTSIDNVKREGDLSDERIEQIDKLRDDLSNTYEATKIDVVIEGLHKVLIFGSEGN